MKKFRAFISIFLVCCLLLSTAGTSASTVVVGDFTHDGMVTSDDLLYLLKAISNSKEYPLSYGEIETTAEPTATPILTTDIESAKVGDFVKLGSYEQDNNTDNGTEDIEWQVLAKEDGKLLVISNYCLDVKPYNDEIESVTWKTCSLRQWLNGEFYQQAFDGEEQLCISKTTIDSETSDNLFILSNDEIKGYLDTKDDRNAVATSYAKSRGAYGSGDNTCWWTRTIGESGFHESYVFEDGSINTSGNGLTSTLVCVRPAMWIYVPEATPTPTPEIESLYYDADNVSVGDTIIMGTYEQDDEVLNGTEDIEWQVLAKEEGRILVVSRYGLDAKKYHLSDTSVTWETCTLRAWLNETFITSAFDTDEQKMIQTTTVVNEDNQIGGSTGGNDTLDKIFLLSVSEAEQYFASDEARKCVPTEYAKANGCRLMDGNAFCWWLRSPGMGDNFAADVYYDGLIYEFGDYVCATYLAVRPAMWISIES